VLTGRVVDIPLIFFFLAVAVRVVLDGLLLARGLDVVDRGGREHENGDQ